MSWGPACVAAAYLLGAVPFGYLLFRWRRGEDIRAHGSGNIGATNMARSAGRGLGAATLLLDVAKGAAAALLAWGATSSDAWIAAAAFAAVVGHCFPVTLRFRGGKGIATGLGAYLVASPPAALAAAVLFAGVTAASRMVSAGSLAAAAALPLAALWLDGRGPMILSAAASAVLVAGRHRDNIRRILAGEENRIHGR
ncbi:MAG TPA: glycerol-3-phosphate 1-O-acyltransferase PlsY [Candidatus Polarisedimenticolia bacterium]|nr:glycerol-3-phosphate 1-O-acyltransferase PlsY [Candidatus Polarisedimenticolia bacterium]